jgi:hypothetical protein
VTPEVGRFVTAGHAEATHGRGIATVVLYPKQIFLDVVRGREFTLRGDIPRHFDLLCE